MVCWPPQYLTGIRLENILETLNRIGKDNGGNRAFGLPGFKASLDFVVERLEGFSDAVDTFIQPFNHTFEQTRKISVTGPDGEEVHAITLIYNPATPEEGITAPLIDTPIDDDIGAF